MTDIVMVIYYLRSVEAGSRPTMAKSEKLYRNVSDSSLQADCIARTVRTPRSRSIEHSPMRMRNAILRVKNREYAKTSYEKMAALVSESLPEVSEDGGLWLWSVQNAAVMCTGATPRCILASY